MSTKIIIPRATSEDSSIGTPEKNWGDGYFDDLHCLNNFYCPLVTSDARGIGELGESKFDTTINALIIWDGEEWLELGATTQVELVLIAGDGGTVEGAGTYSKGAPVIISAVPENSNYVFSYWNGDTSYLQGPDGDRSAQTFVTLSKATTQLTAVFSAKTYDIITTVEGGEGSDIPGLVTTDPVGAAFPAETRIEFQASTYSAFSGKYAFGFWAGEYIENNPEQRTNNPLIINSLSSNINLQAVFELQGKTITMQKYIDDDNPKLVEHFNNNVELLLNGLSLPDGEGVAKEYGYGDSFDFSFTIDTDSQAYYKFVEWDIIVDTNPPTTINRIDDTVSSYELTENIAVRAYFEAVDSNNNTIPDLYDALIQVSEIDSDQDNIIDSYDQNILTAATSNLTVIDQDITNGLNTSYYDLGKHNTKYNISAQLTHQIDFDTNSDGDITYTSGNEDVVTVDDTGLITVVGAGYTSIIITVTETVEYTSVYRELQVAVTDQTDTDGDGLPDNDDTAPNQEEQTITWGQDLTGLTGVTIFDATTSDENSNITYSLSATTLGTLDGNTFTPSTSDDENPITVTATASATEASFETSVTKQLTLNQEDSDGDGIPDRIDDAPNQTEQTITWDQDLTGLTDAITFNATTNGPGSVITYTLSATTLGTLDGNTFTPSNSISEGSITVTATASATEASFEKTLQKTLTLDQTDSDGDDIPDRLQGLNLDFVSESDISISGGFRHTLYVKDDGKVLATGMNTDGQIGDGTVTDNSPYFGPTEVKLAFSTFDNVAATSGGLHHSVYLKNDGTVWAAGKNDYGQLGDGTEGAATKEGVGQANPVQVIDSGGNPFTDVVAISAGFDHTVYLKDNQGVKEVWTVGRNVDPYDRTAGQLGYESPNISNPSKVNINNVVAIAAGGYHTVYLKSDGTVWASGYNGQGQLGDGTWTTSRLNPVQVIDAESNPLTNVVAISAGQNHTVYLKNDKTVWAAGANNDGQLGDGTTTTSAYPTQVTNADDSAFDEVVGISAGHDHTVYLKRDGTVWAVGDNYQGQLGDRTTTNRSNPVQVTNGDGSVFDGVVGISSGGYHTVYLKSDGTVWGTGQNSEGELGDGRLQSAAFDNNYPVKSWFFDRSAPDTIGKFENHTLIVDAPAGVAMPSNGTVPTQDEEGKPLFLWYPNGDEASKVGFQLDGNSIEIVNTLDVNVKFAKFGDIHLIYTDEQGNFDSLLHHIGTYDDDYQQNTSATLHMNYLTVSPGTPYAKKLLDFNAALNISQIHGLYGYFAFYTED
jgi:alpha-tubulin suppressor-like RCC1 family protein